MPLAPRSSQRRRQSHPVWFFVLLWFLISAIVVTLYLLGGPG